MKSLYAKNYRYMLQMKHALRKKVDTFFETFCNNNYLGNLNCPEFNYDYGECISENGEDLICGDGLVGPGHHCDMGIDGIVWNDNLDVETGDVLLEWEYNIGGTNYTINVE